MFQIQAPVLIVPSTEARQALGSRLRLAGLCAYREIAVAAKGLEIAHLQFAFFELTLAVCSHVRRDGIVEIEIGLGNAQQPARTFTAAQMHQAVKAATSQAKAARQARSARAY
jgi:hypothetical protein